MTNPQDQERLDMQDFAFREEMRAKQEADPNAKRWVQLDEQASTIESKVDRDQRALHSRPQTAAELESQLAQAREERAAWKEANPRPSWFSGGQKEWDADYQKLDGAVASARKEFSSAVKKASPEELEKLQAKIQERRETLVATIAERQGIAMLPSEDAERHMAKQPGNEALADRLAARRAQQEQEQGREDGQGDGTRAGRRLQPNYAAYAETMEDRRATQQLEDAQRTMHQRLGRHATDAEMRAYEAQRDQKDQVQTLTGMAAAAGFQASDQHDRLDALRSQNQEAMQAARSEPQQEQGDQWERFKERHGDLLTNGPNKNGDTALHKAAANGYDQVTKDLVAQGHDVNAMNNYGESVMWVAIAPISPPQGDERAIQKTLMDAGADLSVKNHAGHTLLHCAATAGDAPMCGHLVQTAGLAVNAVDLRGNTPLMLAADVGKADTCQALLELGADPAMKNSDHKDARGLAKGEAGQVLDRHQIQMRQDEDSYGHSI